MELSTSTLRTYEPHPGIFAYYDGRIVGHRLYGPDWNWLDDGAYGLGVASFAVVSGEEAVVCDTHISVSHAKFIRSHLEGLGVKNFRVVITHFHNDHIAGASAFADCEIIVSARTAELIKEKRDWLMGRKPVIEVVDPSRTFSGRLDLKLGTKRLELLQFHIHREDHSVIWLPDDKILLAGDCVEDTVTYIAEPSLIRTHIAELKRLKTLPIESILPSHGDPERIASSGYSPSFIDATISYLEKLADQALLQQVQAVGLKEFHNTHIESGASIYFEAYEAVHARNVNAVNAARQSSP